jgi:hypothetical protein
MTHDEAKNSMAAAAYILDDLEPAERDAFEEHFFDCTACAADVIDASEIADGVRTRNVVRFRGYSQWAAAAAIVIAIGMAHHYWPQPSPPSGVAPISIASTGVQKIDVSAARAPRTSFLIVRNEPVSVGFAIEVADPRPPYVCELRDDAGRLIASKTVATKEEASNDLTLLIAAGKFHTGNYTLGIRGDREIPAYHFAVEVQ